VRIAKQFTLKSKTMKNAEIYY